MDGLTEVGCTSLVLDWSGAGQCLCMVALVALEELGISWLDLIFTGISAVGVGLALG